MHIRSQKHFKENYTCLGKDSHCFRKNVLSGIRMFSSEVI
jgi:hypothetical protein